MKISVIIPTYNCNKAYLKESIESVLQQTYKPFEVILFMMVQPIIQMV